MAKPRSKHIPIEVLVNRYHKLGRLINSRGKAGARATRPKKGKRK
jgi:hypothetical protein